MLSRQQAAHGQAAAGRWIGTAEVQQGAHLRVSVLLDDGGIPFVQKEAAHHLRHEMEQRSSSGAAGGSAQQSQSGIASMVRQFAATTNAPPGRASSRL